MTDDRQQETSATLRKIDTTPLRNVLAMAGPANRQALISATFTLMKSRTSSPALPPAR